MSQELDFEHIDADAVCEECGTVNPEETLLCRACGNNLKEQRQRRIAQTYATPTPGSSIRKNSIRALTGLLSVLGLLLVLFVVLNLSNIEAALIEAMSSQGPTKLNLYGGEAGSILDELDIELRDFPSSRDDLWEAIREPVRESAYNGRYALINPNNLTPRGMLGEANLRKQGDSVYFVVQPSSGTTQIRGVAQLEATETGMRAVVSNTASVKTDTGRDTAFGFSAPLEEGGHLCVGQTNTGERRVEVLAYRIR